MIRIHETWAALHVAAIRDVNHKINASAIPNAQRAVMMNVFVIGASKISPWIQALHSAEEIDVTAKDILKWSVPVTDFSHQDTTGFFKDMSFDQTRIICECGQRLLSAQNCRHCFLIAFRAKRSCLSWDPQRRH